MPHPPIDPSTTGTPLTSEAARVAGVTADELRGPGFERVLHDTYLPAGTRITPTLRAMAALTHCSPVAFASHFTAAKHWGLWVPDDPDIHVSGPRNVSDQV